MTRTVIHNCTLIDGTGGDPVPEARILIDDACIISIGPDDGSVPPHAVTIDARGGFILPGFIDCHAHITFEVASVEAQMRRPLSLNFYNSVRYLRSTLDAGITTVRDAGGADLGTKMAVETGVVPGPRLQICITPLSPTGGHFDHVYPVGVSPKTPPYPGKPDAVCDGVDEVRKRVREVLRAGADVIKICATGGVLSPTDRPEYVQFSPEEIRVVVDEARYRGGRKVMAHAIGAEGITNAIRVGVHSIEHGPYVDDDAIELMLEQGTYLVPTLMAGFTLVEPRDGRPALPEDVLAKARQINEHQLSGLEKAHRAGVRIAFGTDAAVFPHGENLRELELMTRAGMTPMEAIVSATKTAAECLGWGDRIGTLEPGKLADLVICDADPLADITALQNPGRIFLVLKGGKIVKDVRPGL